MDKAVAKGPTSSFSGSTAAGGGVDTQQLKMPVKESNAEER
jgi:hypothetical protein